MSGPLLFLDTETTGLLVRGAALDDPGQPHLAQLALLLTDAAGKRVGSFVAYVRPDGWVMSPEAGAVNGLTTDYLEAYGLPAITVWRAFQQFAFRAEQLVAHNVEFDRRVLEIFSARLRQECDAWVRSRSWFCTKEAATPICCLPGRSSYPPRAGQSRYKWPTLDEAHRHLCGGPVTHAHDALADVEACARVYFALQARAAGPAAVPGGRP